ncbi:MULTISPECIES: 2OG-Fe(II) oxygenase [unclassified Luteimonas]|uniref:2OG-Fe(II) oxygenase n=1 Tax=unclassified Luteimonas TaxID=2629088 RepID=UPI0018F0E4C1|nr:MULTISPECIES: 2OG-Fe(II) oxygenase [unclassified Luteimonas]MBJ6980197.1 2OG-Fe(II) oxygenase [Luteimonas sp. MC1895]MBJ6985324.1 2OG-Fe(II) oxygenase [Luteimonas sp. MC1750]QQO05414.1 2OG-Fe(II) oxygenase [Luteimonas sp. MC1750]
MAMQLNVQVAAWLHSQVTGGAPLDQVLPALLRQGFDELQVRRIYNAVLSDPDGFKAGFSRVAAGEPGVAHKLPEGQVHAPIAPAPATGGAPQPPFVPAALIRTGGHAIACDHGAVHVAFRLQRPHVVLFENVLTADECDALIAEAQPRLRRAGVVDSERGGSKIDERRTSELAVVQRGASPLVTRIDARIATITGVPLAQGEPLQVMRYGVGAEYQPHYDYFDLGRPGQAANLRNGGQRIASLVVYLNDVEAGGETTFPRCGLAVGPRKGSAVFFAYTDAQSRTDPMSYHAGAPVTRGEKWIATRWMREREYV